MKVITTCALLIGLTVGAFVFALQSMLFLGFASDAGEDSFGRSPWVHRSIFTAGIVCLTIGILLPPSLHLAGYSWWVVIKAIGMSFGCAMISLIALLMVVLGTK